MFSKNYPKRNSITFEVIKYIYRLDEFFYDTKFYFITNELFYFYTAMLDAPVAAIKPNKANHIDFYYDG